MILGHYAGALAAKRLAPRVSHGTLGVWLFVPWGYWIDRHRVQREREGPPTTTAVGR